MKIVWTEHGLRVVRTIFTVLLAIAGIGIFVALMLIVCGVGSFDLGYITPDEEKQINIRIICGVIIAGVCIAACIFSNKINEAIDDELKRRAKRTNMKKRRQETEQRIARDQYRQFLIERGYANVNTDIQDGEGK